ncbi:kinase-like domain-containing protein [Hyaloraphidium curvatum]|nr:kinase-like domain-containing protein [Hyaloraphidium curvatum]
MSLPAPQTPRTPGSPWPVDATAATWPGSPPPTDPAADGHARRKLYRVLNRLGAGAQGGVRLAVGPAGLCAIKTLEAPAGDARAAETVRRMKAVWNIVPEHPHIVRLLDCFRTRSKVYFVNEFCAGGDLAKYLSQHGSRIDEDGAREISRSLLSALEWLHSRSIVHRDVKPANVLLRDASRPAETLCLADFGSCFVENPERDVEEGQGTPFYLAPELVRGIPYGPGVDLWSFGCIFYELLFGTRPFSLTGSFEDLYGGILRAEYRVPDDSAASTSALEFLASLLTAEPAARLSASDALRCPWMLARTASLCAPRPRDDGGGYEVLLNEMGELVLADLDAADDSGLLPTWTAVDGTAKPGKASAGGSLPTN